MTRELLFDLINKAGHDQKAQCKGIHACDMAESRILKCVGASALAYLDRTKDFDYKINKDDLCYKLFIEKGFEWGGDWTDRKDYQHFELPTAITEKYSEMYSQ